MCLSMGHLHHSVSKAAVPSSFPMSIPDLNSAIHHILPGCLQDFLITCTYIYISYMYIHIYIYIIERERGKSCVCRKESHAIIRELAGNPSLRRTPRVTGHGDERTPRVMEKYEKVLIMWMLNII